VDQIGVLEDLANSRYLMNAYAASSDCWDNFRATGQQASLYEAAAILCGAWTILSEDDAFLEGLSGMSDQKMDADLMTRVRASSSPLPPAADEERNKLLGEFAAYLDTDKLNRGRVVPVARGDFGRRGSFMATGPGDARSPFR
jgi:hypothetical protein